MEGPAQLLTLAPVMWGGLECNVKLVGEWLILHFDAVYIICQPGNQSGLRPT